MSNKDGLVVKINADTAHFNKEMGRIKKQTSSLDKTFRNLAKTSAAAFATGVSAIGLAAKPFADFEEKITQVKTLLNEKSFKEAGMNLSDGFKKMKKDLLNLSATVPVALDDLNHALFDTVSAGISAGDAIDVLREAGKLAVSGGTEVKIAVDGITSAINAYGLSTKETSSIASKFFSAQVEGKTTIEELASGFGVVGSSAAAMGVSINEVLSSVSSLTKSGIKTSESYTALKAVLSNIAKPSADAAKEATRLGVSFNQQALQAKGLIRFLLDLKFANGFTNESITKLFGSTEAVNAVFSLLKKNGNDVTKVMSVLGDEFSNSSKFQNAYTEQSKTLSSQMKILGNIITKIRTEIGEKFVPTLNIVIGLSKKFLSVLEENEGLKSFIANLAIGVTTFGALSLSVAAITTSFIKFRTAVLATSAAVGALKIGLMSFLKGGAIVGILAGIYTYSDEIVNKISQMWKWLYKNIESISMAIKNVFARTFRGEVKEVTKSIDIIKKNTLETKKVLLQTEKDHLNKVSQLKREFSEEDINLNKEHTEAILKEMNNLDNQIDEISREKRDKDISKREEELEEDINFLQRKKSREIEVLTDPEFEKKVLLFQENLQRLSEKSQSLFDQKEIRRFTEKEKNKKEIQKRIATERLEEHQRNREQYLYDEEKFGKTYASIKRFERSSEFRATSQFLDQLEELRHSKSKTARKIGKAAAISKAIIDTIVSGNAAASAVAGIPLVGPALAIAARAAALAAGYAQVERIKAIPAMKGAYVERGFKHIDSELFMLAKGETVVPSKNYEEMIQGVINQRMTKNSFDREVNSASNQEVQVNVNIEFDGNEAAQFLRAKLQEDEYIGLS